MWSSGLSARNGTGLGVVQMEKPPCPKNRAQRGDLLVPLCISVRLGCLCRQPFPSSSSAALETWLPCERSPFDFPSPPVLPFLRTPRRQSGRSPSGGGRNEKGLDVTSCSHSVFGAVCLRAKPAGAAQTRAGSSKTQILFGRLES